MSDRAKKSRKIADDFRAKPQRTVMLVEDLEVDRIVYKRYLQTDLEYQYTFVEVESGESAIEIYPQSQPDIILLDYLLPDIDGLEWLAQWQQKYQLNLCPVIVITGQGDENIAVQFIKLGAADYLVKGQITAEKLKLSVGKEIALRQLKQEKQDFVDIVRLQNNKLGEANQLLQYQINQCEISERLFRSSEKKLSRALANAPIPIIIHAEDGEILQINRVWTELTGYSIEDIPTIADWTEKAYGAKQEIVKSSIDRLYELDRRVEEGEFAIITASGQVRIWDFSSAPLDKLADGRRLVISAAKDVTDIKQAEIALQKSEAKFRNTFEQAAVGLAHVAPDGKWLMVNQKLCQIVGYTKEELLQKTFQDITHPEDLESDLEYVRQMLAGEISTYSLEKRYICKDGSSVWINLTVSLVRGIDGEPEYFISAIEDISARHQLRLLQEQSLQRLSNLHQIDKAILEARSLLAIAKIAINNIQQLSTCQRASIVTFDSNNETATVLVTKGRAEETVGEGFQVALNVWQDLIHQLKSNEQDYLIIYLSQFPHLSAAISALGASQLDCFICFPLQVKNELLGIFKLWVANSQAITTEELAIVSEISTQVAIALQQANLSQKIQNYASELELKVAERTTQLEEINQELKAFTYSISHDLKAPLRAIQGFAIALQEDYDENLDELGREYTKRLAGSAQQMEQLIQDLLAYSRLSRTEIKMQSVDLVLLVDKTLEQLDSVINETQAQITVDEPLLNIFGNRTVLLQVVNNLLSNAIKFTNPDVKPKIRIWTENREKYVRLWIEDNGIGIEPHYQERIFRVFERLHGNEVYPGTGIGLAIVKKGMERLGGKFGVESEVNRGSRFWIELPQV